MPRTIPIPVSSQLVSIPKTTGSLLKSVGIVRRITIAATPSGW